MSEASRGRHDEITWGGGSGPCGLILLAVEERIFHPPNNRKWAENKDVMLSSLHFQKLWLVQCGEWTSRSAWEENRARGSEEASYEVSGIV